MSATLEPGYSHLETDVTDQAGVTRHESTDVLTQRYRLGIDRVLTEYLTASAGGTLLDDRAWRRADGLSTDDHGRTTSLYARLSLGTPVLSAGLGADRREQQVLGSAGDAIVNETFSAFAAWRPLELPELELRASRSHAYDAALQAQDITTDSVLFSTRYKGPRYDLKYSLGWSRSDDHIHLSETTSVDQTVLGSRTDALFNGRTSTYVTATLQNRNTTVLARGTGGTVARQQIASLGLSAVVTFPASSDNVALAANPAATDGITVSSAGLDVGFGPSALGDQDPREIGARFPDVVTAVNTLYLWLDRAPAGDVGRALAAAVQVWQSDDGQHWTRLDAATVVAVPSRFENRIDVTIPQTAARYLKASLRPLATGLTVDPTFRDVYLTELQFFLVLPIALVPHQQTSTFVSATGLARTLILPSPELSHDITASVARHLEGGGASTYTLVNGLSASHKLSPGTLASTRVARQDFDAGRGHEGVWQWTAALTGKPIPAANWSLTYSGSASDRDEVTHSLTGLGRADWYEGIATQATASGAVQFRGQQVAQNYQASETTTLSPNRMVTVTAGAQYSRTVLTSPDTGEIWSQSVRIDGGLALTPAPALSASGTVSRIVIGVRPTTLATLQLNYFPLRGDVQLAATYSKTLDTEADVSAEYFTPSLRWNIRSGASLTVTYTHLRNSSPAQVEVSRVIAATLLVNL